MSTRSVLFLRVLPTVLLCLTLTGAADATGPVVAWGLDDWGQATPPDAVNGVDGTATQIAADYAHSCAIQAGTGNVVCWGYNNAGQAQPPDNVNGVAGTATQIAAGQFHSCAIQGVRTSSSAGATPAGARRRLPMPSTASRERLRTSWQEPSTVARSRRERAMSSAGAMTTPWA